MVDIFEYDVVPLEFQPPATYGDLEFRKSENKPVTADAALKLKIFELTSQGWEIVSVASYTTGGYLAVHETVMEISNDFLIVVRRPFVG
jgi:hypothetical protein